MITVSHRIAGLVFRTESDYPVPRLQEGTFAQFITKDGALPDVYQRLRRIDSASLLPEPPAESELVRLLSGARLEVDSLDNPLLRSPAVLAWLRAGRERSPQEIGIEVYRNLVIGRDYAQRVLHCFYSEDYGQDQMNGVEDQPQIGPDGKIEPRFYIRRIDFDPQATPPLTQEERRYLARKVDFLPPEVLDLPLLRAPAVRAWLRQSLARSEEVKVGTYTDGILVWNLDRQRLDFFYRLEYGNTPEGHVAVYFPRIFSAFLPQFSALLVHSSGVILNGKTALFLARDGGGKTTVLQQATEMLLLNDDQIVVRQEGDKFIAYSTPFGRMTSGPCQAPLGGLFFLERARTFELEPYRPAELVHYLWEEHLLYHSMLPRDLKQHVFDLFYEMCHQVPIYRMRFPKDYVDWDAIDAVLA